jgi:hypothetical protein
MATALVSEPPRPERRDAAALGLDALKARDDSHLALLQARADLVAGHVLDARHPVRVVGENRDLPALPGARRDAHPLQHDGEQARPVTCSPVATMASYSRASCRGEASRTQATSWLVTPAMAETTTATRLPASISRLTWRATLRMRSTLATDVPPNFITRKDMTTRVCAPGSSSLRLAMGLASPQETLYAA